MVLLLYAERFGHYTLYKQVLDRLIIACERRDFSEEEAAAAQRFLLRYSFVL